MSFTQKEKEEFRRSPVAVKAAIEETKQLRIDAAFSAAAAERISRRNQEVKAKSMLDAAPEAPAPRSVTQPQPRP